MEKSIHIQKRKALSSKNKERIIDGISYLFIFLFIYTAYDKGMEISSFSKSIGRYSLIKPYADQIAWMVPAAEVFVAVLLIGPKTQKLGLKGALILMISFTAFLLHSIFVLNEQFCKCGGVISKMNATEHIWFNIAFIALAIIGIRLLKKSQPEED